MDKHLLTPITVLYYDTHTLDTLHCAALNVPTENGRAILTKEFRERKLIVAVLKGHVTPLDRQADDRALTILYYDKAVMTIVEAAHIDAHDALRPPPLKDPLFMHQKMLIAAFAGQVTVLNKTGERWGTPAQMAAAGEAA